MPMHPNVLFLAEVLLSDEGFFLIGCYAGCIARQKCKFFFIFIFLLLKACGSGSSGKRQVTTAEPGTLVIN